MLSSFRTSSVLFPEFNLKEHTRTNSFSGNTYLASLCCLMEDKALSENQHHLNVEVSFMCLQPIPMPEKILFANLKAGTLADTSVKHGAV